MRIGVTPKVLNPGARLWYISQRDYHWNEAFEDLRNMDIYVDYITHPEDKALT